MCACVCRQVCNGITMLFYSIHITRINCLPLKMCPYILDSFWHLFHSVSVKNLSYELCFPLIINLIYQMETMMISHYNRCVIWQTICFILLHISRRRKKEERYKNELLIIIRMLHQLTESVRLSDLNLFFESIHSKKNSKRKS